MATLLGMRRCKTCGTRIPANQWSCQLHRRALSLRPRTGNEEISEGDDEEPSWPREFSFLKDLFSEAEIVGYGGFAIVYRARRSKDDRVVALKVAHSRFARQNDAMAREVEVLKALGGRGAPRWIESSTGVYNQPDYICLDFLGGTSLAQRMANFGPILIPDAQRAIVSGLLEAVECLHSCGFVHNDLKPENVILEANHKVYLCDFDLAQRKGERLPGGLLGTPEYMAPERILGEGEADQRSDLYSLGVMLYEIFAGHPPFWGPEVEVRDAQRSARVPGLLPKLLERYENPPPEGELAQLQAIHALVHRCLRKDPARRPQSIGMLKNLWKEALRERPEPKKSVLDLGVKLTELKAWTHAQTGLGARSVGVLWIYSRCDRADLLLQIRDAGGVLVHCERERYVVVCGFEGLANPVKASLEAAARLMKIPDLGLQIVVDVATVRVAYNERNSPFFLSYRWHQRHRYAELDDGRGLFISNPAHELIPQLSVSALEHERYARWNERALLQVPSAPVVTQALVGHSALIEKLRNRASSGQCGQSSLSWIFGSAGRGKSYVSAALAKELRQQFPYERHVFWRMCPQASNGPRQALWDLWRQLFGCDFRKDRVGLGQSRYLSHMQRQEILDLVDAPPSEDEGSKDFDVVARIATYLMRGYCQDHCLVLVVDDAHLLEDAVLSAIRSLCTDRRTNVAAFLFAQEPADRARVVQGEREYEEVLEALSPTQCARLGRQLLRHVASVPQQALDWMAHRSAGNPMMLTGLVRALHRQGVIYPDGQTHRWEIDCEKLTDLPQSPAADWLIEREISSWPPGLQILAQWAAVLPNGFRGHQLEDFVDDLEASGSQDVPTLDPAYGLNRLREAKVLYLDAARRHHFAHAQIRETLLEQLGGDALKKRLA